jgi:N-acetylglucosamine kinase-like BadF-type ATPase
MKIGVDGGGTKTELILITNEDTVENRLLAPGCNPSVVGEAQALAILQDALGRLVSGTEAESASTVTHCLLCMAGSQDFWRRVASSLPGYGKVEAVTDAMPTLELATDGGPGLALHAGTGSFVALRAPDLSFHFIGGFGWRIGDPGSAQDIGRRALSRAVAELQGWESPSAIGEAARALFGTSEPGAVTAAVHAHAEPNRLIGSFAEQISILAANGETPARKIVVDAASELLRSAEQAACRYFSNQALNTLTAGLSGRILNQDFVAEALAARTTMFLKRLSNPPIDGVQHMLAKMNG